MQNITINKDNIEDVLPSINQECYIITITFIDGMVISIAFGNKKEMLEFYRGIK